MDTLIMDTLIIVLQLLNLVINGIVLYKINRVEKLIGPTQNQMYMGDPHGRI